MKKFIVKTLLKFYLKFIRPKFSKIVYGLVSKDFSEKNKKWEEYKLLGMSDFEELVNSYEYKYDPFQGAIDFSFDENDPGYFFSDKAVSRDCDDFARIWSLWGVVNDFKTTEVVVLNYLNPFKTAHVVTVLEKDNKFYLANYKISGPFNTFKEAVKGVTAWDSYDLDNLIWAKYVSR